MTPVAVSNFIQVVSEVDGQVQCQIDDGNRGQSEEDRAGVDVGEVLRKPPDRCDRSRCRRVTDELRHLPDRPPVMPGVSARADMGGYSGGTVQARSGPGLWRRAETATARRAGRFSRPLPTRW